MTKWTGSESGKEGTASWSASASTSAHTQRRVEHHDFVQTVAALDTRRRIAMGRATDPTVEERDDDDLPNNYNDVRAFASSTDVAAEDTTIVWELLRSIIAEALAVADEDTDDEEEQD